MAAPSVTFYQDLANQAFDHLNHHLGNPYATDVHEKAFRNLRISTIEVHTSIKELPVAYSGDEPREQLMEDVKTVAAEIMSSYADTLWPKPDALENKKVKKKKERKKLRTLLETYLSHMMMCVVPWRPKVDGALQILLAAHEKGSNGQGMDRKAVDEKVDGNEMAAENEKAAENKEVGSGLVRDVVEGLAKAKLDDGPSKFLTAEDLLDEEGQDDEWHSSEEDLRADSMAPENEEPSHIKPAATLEPGWEVVEGPPEYAVAQGKEAANDVQPGSYLCTCSIDSVDGKDIECGESFKRLEDLQDHQEKEHEGEVEGP